MNTVLLTAGVVALLAAVVGGGLTAFNVELPVLKSLGIRVVLGVLGVAFLIATVLLRQETSGEDPAVARYERQVAATCGAIRVLSRRDVVRASASTAEGQTRYDRAMLLSGLRFQMRAIDRRLDLLLAMPVPDSLRKAAESVRRRAQSYRREFRVLLPEFAHALPKRPTLKDVEAAATPFRDQLDESGAPLEDAMTQLGDRDCRGPSPVSRDARP